MLQRASIRQLLPLVLTPFQAALVLPALAAEPSVQGRLVGPDGRGIAGAEVSATLVPEGREAFAGRFGELQLPEAGRARSGADGDFDLVLPVEGFYRVVVRADGYLPAERSVLVPANDPVSLMTAPLRPARRVRLEVLDPDGRKLAGAKVRVEGTDLFQGGGGWQAFAVTGAEGFAELAVPAGEGVAIFAAAPGLAGGAARLAAGAERATLRLEAGSPLPVLVTGPGRRPLPGVTVFLADARLPLGVTGPDGTALLRVLPDQKRFGFADAAGREGFAVLPHPAGDPPVPPLLLAELADPEPVRGQVVERATRQGIEGAWVFFFQGEGFPAVARSDRAGYFELPPPPSSALRRVGAFKAGFRQGGAIAAGSAEVAIELEPAARVEGRVVDATGRPVGGASVFATTEDGPFGFDPQSFGVSRPDGHFTLTDLPVAPKARVKAVAGFLASPVVEADLGPGAPAVELVLARPASLAVRVLDPRGEAVVQAEVFAANRSDPSLRMQMILQPTFEGELSLLGSTDGEGILRVAELAPGNYDLAARAPGFAPAIARKVAVGGQDPAGRDEQEIELRLRPSGVAKGRVVDETGQGVTGAELHLSPVPDDPNQDRLNVTGRPSAISGAGGEFAVAGVDTSRRFHLVAVQDGYVWALLRNALADERNPLVLVLRRGGRVTGTIAAAGRHPGPVTVHLLPEQGESARRNWQDAFVAQSSVVPDAGGCYYLERVKPGRYRLSVGNTSGYQPFTSEAFELRSGETRTLDIELQEAAVVTGTVLLPNGQPASAEISFDQEEASPWSGFYYGTDGAGRFRVATAKPGPGRLTVRSIGYRGLEREVEIAPGENIFELKLEAGPLDLEARVVDREGGGVAGAQVFLMGEGRNRYEATSAEGGQVRFAGIEKGKYRLFISHEGYAFPPRELTFARSQQGLEWLLESARARLAGAVLGLAEPACAELQVKVQRGGQKPAFGKCDNGRYAVEGLASGSQTLIAASVSTGRVAVQQIAVAEGQTEVEMDLDFRSLAGPWIGRLRLGDQDLRNVRYGLQSRDGYLLSGLSADGRIELYADPGRYRLAVLARPMEDFKTIEIEIGIPSEQIIDVAPP